DPRPSRSRDVSVSVTAAGGFVAGGGAVGIKDGNRPDLAIVATADRIAVPAAAVFTTNLACAAPVQVSRAHLTDGHAAAVVLSPAMATMLAVLTTDARVEPAVLRRALADAVASSFDRLCVDGCRSTNDTVAVLASGQTGGTLIDADARHEARALTDAMAEVCS